MILSKSYYRVDGSVSFVRVGMRACLYTHACAGLQRIAPTSAIYRLNRFKNSWFSDGGTTRAVGQSVMVICNHNKSCLFSWHTLLYITSIFVVLPSEWIERYIEFHLALCWGTFCQNIRNCTGRPRPISNIWLQWTMTQLLRPAVAVPFTVTKCCKFDRFTMPPHCLRDCGVGQCNF